MIYFISQEPNGPIKIGYSLTNPAERLRSLQSGNPSDLHLLGVFAGTRRDEKALHRSLSLSRIRGEWFRRPAALRALRVFRRIGARGIPGLQRLADRDVKEVARRFQADRPLYQYLGRCLASEVLKGIPDGDLLRRTGIDAPAWRSARRGSSFPRPPAIFAALYTFPRYRRLFDAVPMHGVPWLERLEEMRRPRVVGGRHG